MTFLRDNLSPQVALRDLFISLLDPCGSLPLDSPVCRSFLPSASHARFIFLNQNIPNSSPLSRTSWLTSCIFLHLSEIQGTAPYVHANDIKCCFTFPVLFLCVCLHECYSVCLECPSLRTLYGQTLPTLPDPVPRSVLSLPWSQYLQVISPLFQIQ